MLIMSGSFSILIYPHQRLRHLRPAVDGLADAVTRLYGQDMSALCWSECREGTLARFEGGGWGYQLCFRGSVEDTFTAGETSDTTPPERHAARLVRRDGALSATARMGVWSCAGLRFSQERYQQLLDIWQLN